MSKMTSQILKFFDSSKIGKSKYLENEIIFFLQIKLIHYTLRTIRWQKNQLSKQGNPQLRDYVVPNMHKSRKALKPNYNIKIVITKSDFSH